MPTCPKCGSPEMWDQRKSKFYGTGVAPSGKPKPIWKCKNKACGGVLWPDADEFDQRPPSERLKPSAYKQAKAAMQDDDDIPWDKPPVDGIESTRRHLMQSANLYNLCVKAVNIAIAPYVPEKLRTEEWLQAAVASLWIEASSRRSTDNVTWFSYIDHMPEKPIEKE